jgi:predicted metal-dependent enzyme (double-stranded beta helix superfamily)
VNTALSTASAGLSTASTGLSTVSAGLSTVRPASGVSAALRTALRPSDLAQIARRTADQPELWRALVRFEADRRWYVRLARGDEHEVWLLTWLPGQQTGFHDHGESSGAFVVANGALTERAVAAGRPESPGRRLEAGSVRSFGSHYVHDVRNDGIDPAVSIHAYSPPLTSMQRFELGGDGLLRVTAEERTW